MTFTYLVCERDSEIQHLAIQLPFSLVLHVGDLYFNCHWTLERKENQVKKKQLRTKWQEKLWHYMPNQ